MLVCSDSTAAAKREDRSGVIIQEMLKAHNAEIADYKIVPDEPTAIQQQIKARCSGHSFIFTTGGTGLGPRDSIHRGAVKATLERDADGITEAMRSYGQMRTPLAMMSRGVAGSMGNTLIVTLPGSSDGARESLKPFFRPSSMPAA